MVFIACANALENVIAYSNYQSTECPARKDKWLLTHRRKITHKEAAVVFFSFLFSFRGVIFILSSIFCGQCGIYKIL